MLKAIMVFVLFPFLHSQRYVGEYVSCNSSQIVLSAQAEQINVRLFNIVNIDERASKRTCDILTSAKRIEFEIDPSSKVSDPIPVYLFADNQLIQLELLKNQEAYMSIANPQYRYFHEMDNAMHASERVSAPFTSTNEQNEHYSFAIGYVLISIIVWAKLYIVISKNSFKTLKKTKKCTNSTSRHGQFLK